MEWFRYPTSTPETSKHADGLSSNSDDLPCTGEMLKTASHNGSTPSLDMYLDSKMSCSFSSLCMISPDLPFKKDLNLEIQDDASISYTFTEPDDDKTDPNKSHAVNTIRLKPRKDISNTRLSYEIIESYDSSSSCPSPLHSSQLRESENVSAPPTQTSSPFNTILTATRVNQFPEIASYSHSTREVQNQGKRDLFAKGGFAKKALSSNTDASKSPGARTSIVGDPETTDTSLDQIEQVLCPVVAPESGISPPSTPVDLMTCDIPNESGDDQASVLSDAKIATFTDTVMKSVDDEEAKVGAENLSRCYDVQFDGGMPNIHHALKRELRSKIQLRREFGDVLAPPISEKYEQQSRITKEKEKSALKRIEKNREHARTSRQRAKANRQKLEEDNARLEKKLKDLETQRSALERKREYIESWLNSHFSCEVQETSSKVPSKTKHDSDDDEVFQLEAPRLNRVLPDESLSNRHVGLLSSPDQEYIGNDSQSVGDAVSSIPASDYERKMNRVASWIQDDSTLNDDDVELKHPSPWNVRDGRRDKDEDKIRRSRRHLIIIPPAPTHLLTTHSHLPGVTCVKYPVSPPPQYSLHPPLYPPISGKDTQTDLNRQSLFTKASQFDTNILSVLAPPTLEHTQLTTPTPEPLNLSLKAFQPYKYHTDGKSRVTQPEHALGKHAKIATILAGHSGLSSSTNVSHSGTHTWPRLALRQIPQQPAVSSANPQSRKESDRKLKTPMKRSIESGFIISPPPSERPSAVHQYLPESSAPKNPSTNLHVRFHGEIPKLQILDQSTDTSPASLSPMNQPHPTFNTPPYVFRSLSCPNTINRPQSPRSLNCLSILSPQSSLPKSYLSTSDQSSLSPDYKSTCHHRTRSHFGSSGSSADIM